MDEQDMYGEYGDYGDEDYYGEEDRSMAMYQDGIEGNYRRHRRSKKGKRSIHRYPHKTHQRRATTHSFADQGPTHYGQQHPFHPAHLAAKAKRHAARAPVHGPAHASPYPGDQPDQTGTKPRHLTRRGRRLERLRRRRHEQFNSEDSENYSTSSEEDDSSYDSEEESSSEFDSEEEFEKELGHRKPVAHTAPKSRQQRRHMKNSLGSNSAASVSAASVSGEESKDESDSPPDVAAPTQNDYQEDGFELYENADEYYDEDFDQNIDDQYYDEDLDDEYGDYYDEEDDGHVPNGTSEYPQH
jgi:hypothetical protein